MQIQETQVIKAPRDEVFRIWTDYEAYPTWDNVVFTRVTVAERTENTARLDAEVRFMGLRMKRTERHILKAPEKVNVIGDVPGATNTTVWTFDVVPDGTLVTAVFEVQFKGPLRLLQPVAVWQGRKAIHDWLQAFARRVEAGSAPR